MKMNHTSHRVDEQAWSPEQSSTSASCVADNATGKENQGQDEEVLQSRPPSLVEENYRQRKTTTSNNCGGGDAPTGGVSISTDSLVLDNNNDDNNNNDEDDEERAFCDIYVRGGPKVYI
jgi:hypothetical protein